MHSLLIAGSGGQGILFAGKLLAQAVMNEGRNVTWFPSYGAEVRGGTANCTVVISEGMIGSPVVRYPDTVVVMNEASLGRFQERPKKGGCVILNSTMVKARPGRGDMRVVEVPAGDIAMSLGAPLSANMVITGAVARAESLCTLEGLKKALEELSPKRGRVLEANMTALEKGWECIGD
ncbi:MAG: 2-oxoacid:acceptor oxidoreductase family protein [Nitrospiraceae bacterium]|nr:2-oxoacid:acceptor oxidoreductase family protein [Nitrospiraceae bacterium]